MRKIPIIEHQRRKLDEQEKKYMQIFDMLDDRHTITEIARRTGYSRYWIYLLKDNPDARPVEVEE